MIESSKLSTLLPAADVLAVANGAFITHEECAVARAINSNANVGEVTTEWVGPLSDTIQTKLKDSGYHITNKLDANSRPISGIYIISCR